MTSVAAGNKPNVIGKINPKGYDLLAKEGGMRKYKVGIIGSGARSRSYARSYVESGDIDIVALVDPNPGHRKAMASIAGIPPGYREYDDWRPMLAAHTDLDGAVIASPNFTHAEPAVACFGMGMPLALEKPLEVNQERCESILDAERDHNGRSLIGFVLRSTPFYSTIHRLLRDGAIGSLCSIQADELPSWSVSSIMNRSPWRRYVERSGGAMLEKSCHDMDILNWMMGCRPVSLCSFGDSLIFRPDTSLPETCDACRLASECQYYKEPRLSSQEDSAEADLHSFIREDYRCIYNIDKDIIDVQNIAIQYENGAVANFMLNFNTAGAKSGRNFHAVGLKGRIWGNLQENTVYLYDNRSDEVNKFDTSGDGSGHGGGNRIHALELRRMMAEPEYRPEQNAAAGYLSAVMCFAADRSRMERRSVNFRYSDDNRIEIVTAQ